jgi:hypothetical protein
LNEIFGAATEHRDLGGSMPEHGDDEDENADDRHSIRAPAVDGGEGGI